jgi:hypothetical protein
MPNLLAYDWRIGVTVPHLAFSSRWRFFRGVVGAKLLERRLRGYSRSRSLPEPKFLKFARNAPERSRAKWQVRSSSGPNLFNPSVVGFSWTNERISPIPTSTVEAVPIQFPHWFPVLIFALLAIAVHPSHDSNSACAISSCWQPLPRWWSAHSITGYDQFVRSVEFCFVNAIRL